jgi:transketolase
MGDGEQQEGNIWEAAMEASHYKLDNLVGIIDRNRLQIDGWVKDVMDVEPLPERYRSFGWEVIEIDGHDMEQVVSALQKAKSVPVPGKPTVIIANTVKGKGVSFMENIAGWHGKAPSYDEMVKALDELELKDVIAYDALLKKAKEYQAEVEVTLAAKMPRFSRDYWWNKRREMKVKMEPTRKGFG